MEGSLVVEVKDWMPEKTALIVLSDCIHDAAQANKKEADTIRSIQVRPRFDTIQRELPSQIMRSVEAPPERVNLVIDVPTPQAAKAFEDRVLPLVRKRLVVITMELAV